MTPSEIKKKYEALKSERSTIEGIWDEIERYVMPFRGKMFQKDSSENAIDWRKYELYDSTAVQAAETLAASMQGSLVSPATKWFYLNFKNPDLMMDNDAKEWLEACEEQIFMSLAESNFNLEVAECLLELSGFHTASLIEEWDDFEQQLVFTAVAIKEAFFEFDHHDRVVTFIRHMEWTMTKIVEKFGLDNLPDTLKQKAENPANSKDRFDILFAIYRNKGYNKEANPYQTIAEEAREWHYQYVLKSSGEILGKTGGYHEQPASVPRWRKYPGSDFGYGPSQIALPDIKMLNTLVEMIVRATEKVVDPCTMGTQRGVIGDLNLEPGGHTIVRTMDELKVLESGARFDVSDMQKRELQQSIRQTFRVDELELKESPAMTATEVQVRYELMQRLLGPTLGRLQNDLLDPIITRTFRILYRNGKMPPLPKILQDSAEDVQIEYIGPLARAQKLEEVAATEQWIAGMATLAEVNPEILDLIDFDAMGRETAEMRGVPARILRSEAEVKRKRREREEQAARMRGIEQAAMEGEAMKRQAEGAQALEDLSNTPGRPVQ